MTIGERVKCIRQTKGLSMAELAERTGISEASVCRWESGNITSMRCNLLIPLAKALDTTPNELLGWDDIPKSAELDYQRVKGVLHDVMSQWLSVSLTARLTDEIINELMTKAR